MPSFKIHKILSILATVMVTTFLFNCIALFRDSRGNKRNQFSLETKQITSEFPLRNFNTSSNHESFPRKREKPKLVEEDWIQVAVISDGFTSNQNLVVLVKSILFNRNSTSSKVHFHIVTLWSDVILDQVLRSWKLPHVAWTIYKMDQYLSLVSWIPNEHYSGLFGMSKLILPEILSSSKDLKEVIVLDTDLVFQNDVIELWEKRHDVRKASNSASFGLVENQSDWYKQSSHWPAIGYGFNTGLMIILLDRVRAIDWMSLWPIIAQNQLNIHEAVQLADQDIFNTVFYLYPSLVHTLPCSFNCQFPQSAHHKFQFCPQCNFHAKVFHWNYMAKNSYFQTSSDLERLGHHRDILLFYTNLDGYQFRATNQNADPKYEHFQSTQQNIDMERHDFRPTNQISELSEPNEQDPCYFWSRKNDFRVHKFFMPYILLNNSAKTSLESKNEFEVTLVTQFTFDRMTSFESVARSWEQPISAALYISEANVFDFIQYWVRSDVLSIRRNIALHIVYKIPGRAYPINFLRNLALDSSQGEFVFVVDVDFVPSRHLAFNIGKEFSQHFSQSSQKNLALVIPAFEIIKVDVTAEYETPGDKNQLLKLLRQGEIIPFMAARWPLGHKATNFSKWYSAQKPYQVLYERDFEPYLVLRKSSAPSFFEKFSGYGWNKSVWVYQLAKALRFEFWVTANAFVVHLPHVRSSSYKDFADLSSLVNSNASSVSSRWCLERLKKEAMTQIDKNSQKSNHTKFSTFRH